MDCQISKTTNTFKKIVKDNVDAFIERFDKERKSVLLFCVETNTNSHGDDVQQITRGYPHCVHFKHKTQLEDKLGFSLSHCMKEDYVINMYNALSEGGVVIDSKCGTCNPEMSVPDLADMLGEQLTRLKRTPNGKITAKINGKNIYGGDDLGMVAMMATTWPRRLPALYQAQYQEIHDKYSKIRTRNITGAKRGRDW
jgi:hypothetical protein